MVSTFESVLEADATEVFEWFSRPGALSRLTPPWSGAKPLYDGVDLRAGRAILEFPLGLRWVAQHDPRGYVEGSRFADEAVLLPFRLLPGGWRHSHEIRQEGKNRTRVIDEVETKVPARFLTAVFAFRHRQLAEDFAAQRRIKPLLHAGAKKPQTALGTIALTGADGNVGTALRALLTTRGHTVVRLTRGEVKYPDQRHWDPKYPAEDLLVGVDAVVHLAGASIAGRFTEHHQTLVRESRVGPTRALAERAATTPQGPRVFVCASAIGIYGANRAEEELHETSERGGGFLADVVDEWENACGPAAAAGLRVVNVRTGIVQSARGGVLALTRTLFGTGLGGRLGDGQQWMSWISQDDLCDIYYRAIVDSHLQGPVNAVAPSPVRNREYTSILAGVMRRPAIIPAPTIGLKIILGETGARELALAHQKVVPTILREAGHVYRYPHLEQALKHELGHEEMPEASAG